MSDVNVVYALYHIYDRDVGGIIEKESKRIGFFESAQKCEETIETYKSFKGFRDHPISCFKILKYEVEKEYWREEFMVRQY